ILPFPEGLEVNLGWRQWSLGRFTILDRMWERIALHFVALFVAAMECHGELARTRPTTRHLTGFYLCMSVGGVLGGLFNAVVAPIAFNSLLEYPLVIALACVLLPQLGLPARNPWTRMMDMVVPACICGFGLAAAFVFLSRDPTGFKFLDTIGARLPE